MVHRSHVGSWAARWACRSVAPGDDGNNNAGSAPPGELTGARWPALKDYHVRSHLGSFAPEAEARALRRPPPSTEGKERVDRR